MQNNNFAEQLINQVLNNKVAPELVAALLDRFELNWEVSKEVLTLPNGKPSGFFGLVGSHNDEVYGTCREDYEVFQNYELAELAFRLAGATGADIQNCGQFNKGQDIYMQLKTSELKGIGKNRDTVTGYATAINNHGGKRALKWGASNITISCKNTFNMAFRQLANRAKHTASMRDRVEQSLIEIEFVRQQEAEVFSNFSKMAEVEVERKNIIEVVQTVTGVDLLLSKEELDKNYTTYSLDRVNELLAAISGEMEEKGETLWGLFSGVTKYTTHVMPAGRKENGRIESKMVGKGLQFDNKAYEMLLPA